MRAIRGVRSALAVFGLIAVPALAQQGGAEMEALIKAARAEGEVVFYTGATENIAKRTSDAFTAKYGVKASFIRTAGVQTIRRFSTEAEAGSFAADFFLVASGLNEFSPDALKKGWIEPIAQAGIAVVRSGEFPARFIKGASAIIQVAPWGIAYNKDKLKGADIPRDWPDLLHPRFKGQILVAEPRASDAYSDIWSLLLDRLGESYLSRLREQGMRYYANAVPTVIALAAGEGLVAIPSVGGLVQGLVDKGAPIATAQPTMTTGVEMQITLGHRARAKHPNAARLWANFVMSPEGNRIFNADPGSLSVYDTSGLPAQYESPKPGAVVRVETFVKLLGGQ